MEQSSVKRTESNSSMSENDLIASRLKQFIEKLENDKTELFHQLQDEKRLLYGHNW